MLLIIVIILVAYIVIPIVDLTVNERMRTSIKVCIYLLTLLYVLYVLIFGKVVV